MKAFGGTLFRRDNRALAALEFALVAPLLILMGIGAIEFSAAIRAQMQVDQIAHTVANLISNQQPSVAITAAQLKDYLVAAQAMYNYSNVGTLSVAAASVNYTNEDTNGSSVASSTSLGWDASAAAGAGYSPFPANVGNSALNELVLNVGDTINNDSVIVVAASAGFKIPFAPNFFGVIPNQLSFETVAFARPRYQLQIAQGF